MASKSFNKHLVIIGHLMYLGLDYNNADEVTTKLELKLPNNSIEMILDWFIQNMLSSVLHKHQHKQQLEQQQKNRHSNILKKRWKEYQERIRYADLKCFAKPEIDIVDDEELKIPVKIQAYSSPTIPKEWNCEFKISASYSNSYRVKDVIESAMKLFHQKYAPNVFCVRDIDSSSFIQQMLHLYHCDEQWEIDYNKEFLNQPIVRYSKSGILSKGMTLWIAYDKYKHKVYDTEITCKYMLDESKHEQYDILNCPIYKQIKYQYICNKENLSHMYSFIHYKDEFAEKEECKFKDDCKAYKRLENGGNNTNDLCHMTLYKHPPRKRKLNISKQDINAFAFNEDQKQNVPLYERLETEKQMGDLKCLIKEVIDNGYKRELCLTDSDFKNDIYSIMECVKDKLKSKRHKAMQSPLNKAEMLSLILYTGCDCNYDLCKSQREANYTKWKWFDLCLFQAIQKLHNNESALYKVYSGVENVKLDKKNVNNGYFKTYVSTSCYKQISISFMGSEGMMIEFDQNLRDGYYIKCCDVSWISKFPNEYEVLFARSIHGHEGFKAQILDESNGIQTVLLSSHVTL